MIYSKGNWDDHLPLIEFAYKNSYHSSVQMNPYEDLFGEDANLLLNGLKLVKRG